MTLTLNVTWPVERDISIQVDCTEIQIVSECHATRASGNVSDIDIINAFGENNRVCDVDRYRIRCHGGGHIDLFPHAPDVCQIRVRRKANSYIDTYPQANFCHDTLVIILESPHRDEYQYDCINCPIAPAQGSTGCEIKLHFVEVISLCQDLYYNLCANETRVILCNPVQFQTSLVAVVDSPKWRSIRNKIWKALWSIQEIQSDFEERLISYSPNYIINACTSVLRKNVSDFLRHNRFPDAMKYETNHPSSWQWRQWRQMLTHI